SPNFGEGEAANRVRSGGEDRELNPSTCLSRRGPARGKHPPPPRRTAMSESDRPTLPDEVMGYYLQGREQRRLDEGAGLLERLRTLEIIGRSLAAPSQILDVGGAAGVYSVALAGAGHELHLIDPVPLHVEQARVAFAALPDGARCRASVGDARRLDLPEA